MNLNKILIVLADNDKLKRELVRPLIPSDKYEVVEASNGKEAINYASKYKADIVLTSVGVEFIDGFNVCKYIKSDPLTKEVAVVVYAPQTNVDLILKGLDAGADDYVVEPFDQIILSRKIDKIVKSVCKKNINDDIRYAHRKQSNLTVTWQVKKGDKFEVTFKEVVIDISTSGMAIEHYRQNDSNDYVNNSVHPKSQFFAYSAHVKNSSDLTFYISLPKKKIIKVDGKIVYEQPYNNGEGTDRIGVAFTKISSQVKSLISEYVEETIRLRKRDK